MLCKSLDAEVDSVVRGSAECSLGGTVREDSLSIPCKKKKRREKVSEFECRGQWIDIAGVMSEELEQRT